MSFGAIALLIVYMASASVLEKFYGTGAVMKWGYHSPVFIGLWAAAALSGIACLYLKIIKGRRLPEIAFATAGIHIALVLILAGALLTHVSGRQGTVHLRTGGLRSRNIWMRTEWRPLSRLPYLWRPSGWNIIPVRMLRVIM